MKAIIQGLKRGKTVYYTGKAGTEWVSFINTDAFEYPTLEEACIRTRSLNNTSYLHKVTFCTVGLETA